MVKHFVLGIILVVGLLLSLSVVFAEEQIRENDNAFVNKDVDSKLGDLIEINESLKKVRNEKDKINEEMIEKLEELKRKADEQIKESEKKIEELKNIQKENNSTNILRAIEQSEKLLGEAKKLFEKGNYRASLSVAKNSEIKVELTNNRKEVIDTEKILEKREQNLKDREEKLRIWEERLKNRIEKLEEKIQRMERFEEILERHRGEINVEGRNISIKEISPEKRNIIAGKINARLGLNLTAEDISENETSLAALLSNGKLSHVKIMPDRASDIALKRLKVKCGNDNCSIELKEVGNGDKSRAAYVLETKKDSRFLFIFPGRINVRAEIDAETGEVIKVKKSWWSFLASEKDED